MGTRTPKAVNRAASTTMPDILQKDQSTFPDAGAGDVDASGFLLAQPLKRRTLLAALQGLAVESPGRP